jgi:hypothetical protein
MEILNNIKKATTFKKLYDIPFQLNGTRPDDLQVALVCNPCYGFGDIIFCLKIYNYIKEWYGIDCTLFTTKPKPFIENGITKIFAIKIPGKKYEECSNIKHMKIYNVDNNGEPRRRTKTPVKYDLIFATPWIGSDYEPKISYFKSLFPYTNKFNTFLFSEYNAPDPHKYDFPTGIGKRLYGLLITDWQITHERMVENPYLMVHIALIDNVNTMGCFSKFILLMCQKYHKKHHKLDVIVPKDILLETEHMKNLIKKIKKNNYYDEVDIITTKEHPVHTDKESVLRLRSDLTPMPYQQYVSLFNYCLPDVLITGDQSVTDVISCCKNYNIYYQIAPWKNNLAKNLSKLSGAQKNYLAKSRTSCGIDKMSNRVKLKLRLVSEKFDFRKLAKPKLDRLVNNARLLTTNKMVKKYVEIVNNSRKKSKVLNKYKDYINKFI